MPFIKLQFKPGVNRDTTNYSGEGGWWEMDKVRFLSGFPQKLGGWLKSTPNTMLGVCRQMWNWITSYSDNFLACGTNKKVYIEVGGSFYDITPLRAVNPTLSSPTTNNCVDVTNGSKVININIVGHAASTGNYVTIAGVAGTGTPPAIGGIPISEINANHEITVVDADNFTITVSTAATSTLTNQGGTAITVSFEIDVGNAIATYGYGWGTGAFGGLSGSSTYAVTITIASPAVVTYTTYTPVNGQIVVLSTTGALPTGLSIGTPYYIVGAAGATSNLALAAGGTAINTSGSQSGVHTAQLITSISGWGLGSSSPIVLPQTDWWFDNFNNDLALNIRNGSLYYWERGTAADPASKLATRAVLLSSLAGASSVPAKVMQILVSQQDRHLLALGCDPYLGAGVSDFDPMLIRWADRGNPKNWTPSLTVSAGGLRLSRGSRIVRGLPTRQEILVWTDTHLYTLQFIGGDDVFKPQEYADNISIISPRACTSASNITYWMGQDKFYAYTGRVETLACTLRQQIFSDINQDQADQIICGTNEQWNEIWWFYPSANSDWNNRYVIYNHLERLWCYGELERTAWLDTPLRQYPLACNGPQTATLSYLYNHEDGLDDDGSAMSSYIQSNDFDIGDGDQFMLSRRIIPDINFTTSTAANPEVTLQIRPRNFPGSGFQSGETADNRKVIATSVDAYTDQVFIRARARQMALKIMSDQIGVQWQLGSPRLDARQDGKR